MKALYSYTQCILAKNTVPPPRPLLCRRYKPTKMRLRGARHCEAVLVVRPSGKSLSTELRILLASWHVALRKCVASTMRTWLLTMCALRLRLGGGGGRGGSVLVATPDSVHSFSTWLRLRFRLRLERGGVGSAITTLDKKACVKALSGYTQCILAKNIVPHPRPLSCRRLGLGWGEGGWISSSGHARLST